MKKLLLIAMFSILFSCGYSRIKPQLTEFVAFDSVFIPVYYYSGFSDSENALKFVNKLDAEWDRFKKVHKSSEKTEFFTEMDLMVKMAVFNVKEQNFEDAVNYLTDIKYYLLKYREDNHFEYFPDKMIILQESVDNMMLTINAVQNLDDFDISRIESELNDGLTAFSDIESSEFKPETYNFTPYKSESLKKHIKDLKKELSGLQAELHSGNSRQIKASVISLNAKYYSAYKLFGDFNY